MIPLQRHKPPPWAGHKDLTGFAFQRHDSHCVLVWGMSPDNS